eukprot:14740367-Alexandrium_andersonii.AAC.1
MTTTRAAPTTPAVTSRPSARSSTRSRRALTRRRRCPRGSRHRALLPAQGPRLMAIRPFRQTPRPR